MTIPASTKVFEGIITNIRTVAAVVYVLLLGDKPNH